MTELTLFERITWGCKTHPVDIDFLDYRYSGHYVDQTTGERMYSLREFVEAKECNWEWFCQEWGLNHLDENGNW